MIKRCRYSIAVITPVSQTGDAGSTPVICLKPKPVNTALAGLTHNHPNSSPLLRTDYLSSSEYKCFQEIVAAGHNGDVYCFKNTYGTCGKLLGYFDDNGKEFSLARNCKNEEVYL